MPLRFFQFPQLRLITRTGDLELSLQIMLTLNLPQSCLGVMGYFNLVKEMQDDMLWISRQGTSLFNVECKNGGSPISELEKELIADLIKCHETWSRLGLRLVPGDCSSSTLQYSIEHPDLSSSSAAPKEACVAEFREAKCEMTVWKRLTSHTGQRGKSRRIDIGDEGCQESFPQDIDTQTSDVIEEDIYLTLMPDDQRLIDAFLEGFPPSVRKRRTTVMNQLDTIENARAIIKAAMDIALFGGAKRVHGMKVIEGTEVRGLTQLLPGVFHMPHLKMISERSVLLPTIATSLARMTMAESPTLRSKSADFKYGLSAASIDVGEDEKIVRGLEKAAWYTLLKNVQAPALKYRPTMPLQLLTETPQARTSTRGNSELHGGRRHTLYEERFPVLAGPSQSQSSAVSLVSSEPQGSWDAQECRVRGHPTPPPQLNISGHFCSPDGGSAGAPQRATPKFPRSTYQSYREPPRVADSDASSSVLHPPVSPTHNFSWLKGDFTYDMSPASKESTPQTRPHLDPPSLIKSGRQGPPLFHGRDSCSLVPQNTNCYPKATQDGSPFPLSSQTDSLDLVSPHHATTASQQEIRIMDYNKFGSFEEPLGPPLVDRGVNQDFNLNL